MKLIPLKLESLPFVQMFLFLETGNFDLLATKLSHAKEKAFQIQDEPLPLIKSTFPPRIRLRWAERT